MHWKTAALVCLVLAVLFPSAESRADVVQSCTVQHAAEACVFDVTVTGRGKLVAGTRAAEAGEVWRTTVVELGGKRARTVLGTGSTAEFEDQLTQAVTATRAYLVIVT